jgi:predicted Zn-dependent protease
MKQGNAVVRSLYTRRVGLHPWRLALSLSLLVLAGCAQVRAVRTEVANKIGGSSDAPAASAADDGAPLSSPSAIANTYLQHGRYAEGEQRLRQYLARYPNDRAAQNLLRQLTADPRATLGAASRNYTVQAGDSYSTLAARYLGDASRFLLLARYNGSTNPSALRAGDVVRLPAAMSSGATDTLVVHAADADATVPAADAPGNAQRLQAESSALLRQGRKSDALARLDQALKLDPHLKPDGNQALRAQLLSSYHERAVLLYRDQKLDQAIALWDHVLAVDPNYERAVIYRARAVELKQRLGRL